MVHFQELKNLGKILEIGEFGKFKFPKKQRVEIRSKNKFKI